jgi:hypothetical protein
VNEVNLVWGEIVELCVRGGDTWSTSVGNAVRTGTPLTNCLVSIKSLLTWRIYLILNFVPLHLLILYLRIRIGSCCLIIEVTSLIQRSLDEFVVVRLSLSAHKQFLCSLLSLWSTVCHISLLVSIMFCFILHLTDCRTCIVFNHGIKPSYRVIYNTFSLFSHGGGFSLSLRSY